MVQISQELRRKYWATRSSVRSHRSLVRSLAHFAHSLARGKVGILMSQNQAVLNHSTEGRNCDYGGSSIFALVLVLMAVTSWRRPVLGT